MSALNQTICYNMAVAGRVQPQRRVQTLVQLDDSLVAMLDQRAARRGVSRSQVIREAIQAHLADDHDGQVSERIIAGYARIPQSVPDQWGDPWGSATATTHVLHHRLDAEEREQGQPPW